MADRFYIDAALAAGPISLEGSEAHHLATVCRLRAGDRVCLFNGDGRQYPAEVVAVSRRRVEVQVLGVEEPARELGFRLEVAVPLPKGDRAQFLVEKLTELGATALVPLQTRRSVVYPRAAKRDKLQRHVIEASKQCGRNVLLRVEDVTEWESYCGRDDLARLRILAHPGGDEAVWQAGQDCVLAVGPEGGFTDDEVQMARGHGWHVVGLGPRILRIETAALLLAAWSIPRRC